MHNRDRCVDEGSVYGPISVVGTAPWNGDADGLMSFLELGVTDGARTRDLLSHNPPTPVLRVAAGCTNGLDKPISLLTVAHGFCLLRSKWCQKWCRNVGYWLDEE